MAIQTLFGTVPTEPNLLDRLKAGIEKTRTGLVDRIEDVISGKKEIDADLLDELEYTLITADLGVRTVSEILENIRQRADRKQTADATEIRNLIREHLLEILSASEIPTARRRATAGGCDAGRRQWGGEDHHYRQTGSSLSGREAQGAALCCRYVPCCCHRAA